VDIIGLTFGMAQWTLSQPSVDASEIRL